ncbi:MAG: hypothetical protein KatS3mg061_2380 [Dehalococcoidia bacterium]|nr:MAG: hypothetical protein KatS3mg061_2380 [Dehalococcoidia bacterium]
MPQTPLGRKWRGKGCLAAGRLPAMELPPLVDVGWLAARLDEPALRVIDCRWRGDGSGWARYAAGHLPGALYLDWSRHLRTRGPLPRGVPAPAAFARLMGCYGISA